LEKKGIYDKDYSWDIVDLNFEILLVLNHDDVTWDYLKMGDLDKRI
jgi:hypothetical protein